MPSFQSSLSKNRRETEVSNVIRDVNIARSEAIKRAQRVVICTGSNTTGCNTNEDWSNGWIVFVDDDANDQKGSSEQLLRIGTIGYSDFTLIGSTDIAHNIKFQPDGVAIDTGTLTLCDSHGASSANAIILSASGRPKISTTAAGGATLTCP